MQHAKLVIVQTCGSLPEADLAISALDAAGIEAMVQSDTAGGMREHLAWSGVGFKILVREEDATEAREVLTPPAGTPANEGGDSADSDLQTDRGDLPPLRQFT